jgi:transposase
MAKPLVPDELWEVVEPLLPRRRVRRGKDRGGRPPVDDRAALGGVLFVLRTGIPWEDLPREMGCGSGMTCWRRLRDWHRAGVFARLHAALLARLNAAGKLDWSRLLADSASVRAVFGGRRPARAPWTAGNPGRNTTCSRSATARRPRRA